MGTIESVLQPNEQAFANRLVSEILNGSLRAESELATRYFRSLKLFISSLAKDADITDEVVQETWLLVLVKLRANELKDKHKLKSYIFQIGRNVLIQHFRKQRLRESRFGPLDEHATNHIQDFGPDHAAQNSQLGQAINRVFSRLSQPRDKRVLDGYLLKGHSKTQLSQELGVNASHFDKVFYRARKRFQSDWKSIQQASA